MIEQAVVPAICTNDEILELQAVLAGKVIAQLAGVTAAPYIRSGQLVPLLVDHIPDRASYLVYFGSRTSQTARARAFIDLAVERLVDNREYVLTDKELRATGQGAVDPSRARTSALGRLRPSPGRGRKSAIRSEVDARAVSSNVN